jgi:hypothetical protein
MNKPKTKVRSQTKSKVKSAPIVRSKTKVKNATNANRKSTYKELQSQLEKTKRQIMGSKSDAQGLRYEQNTANYFRNKGWNIKERYKKYGYEYDIYGTKDTTGVGDYRYLIVECKDKARVTAKDVLHFIAKTHIFAKHIDEDIADSSIPLDPYLCYTGEIDKDATIASRSSKPHIKLLKLALSKSKKP